MRFDGDIIITDPCYIIRETENNDWDYCDYGNRMDNLGITRYLTGDTLYGDWSCTTFKTEAPNEEAKFKQLESLGRFCADSGMVGVFLLSEVLAYNPKFDYHIEFSHTTTLIEDFHGYIRFEFKLDENEDTYVSVVGEGNINFFTTPDPDFY